MFQMWVLLSAQAWVSVLVNVLAFVSILPVCPCFSVLGVLHPGGRILCSHCSDPGSFPEQGANPASERLTLVVNPRWNGRVASGSVKPVLNQGSNHMICCGNNKQGAAYRNQQHVLGVLFTPWFSPWFIRPACWPTCQSVLVYVSVWVPVIVLAHVSVCVSVHVSLSVELWVVVQSMFWSVFCQNFSLCVASCGNKGGSQRRTVFVILTRERRERWCITH